MKYFVGVIACMFMVSNALALTPPRVIPKFGGFDQNEVRIPRGPQMVPIERVNNYYRIIDDAIFPRSTDGIRDFHENHLPLASPDAAYALGEMAWEDGETSEAIYYFMLAEEFGSTKAARIMEQVVEQLSPEEMEIFTARVHAYIENELYLPQESQLRTYEYETSTLERLEAGEYKLPRGIRRNPYMHGFPFLLVVAPNGRPVEWYYPPETHSYFDDTLEDFAEGFRFTRADTYSIYSIEIAYIFGEFDNVGAIAHALNEHATPAKNGHRPSQSVVGELTRLLRSFEDEEGLVIPDELKPENVYYWLQLAARQGHVDAQARLGIGFLYGQWTQFLIERGQPELQRQAAIVALLRFTDEELRQLAESYLRQYLEQNPRDEVVQAILEQEVE